MGHRYSRKGGIYIFSLVNPFQNELQSILGYSNAGIG
jgi:hypothetical protein